MALAVIHNFSSALRVGGDALQAWLLSLRQSPLVLSHLGYATRVSLLWYKVQACFGEASSMIYLSKNQIYNSQIIINYNNVFTANYIEFGIYCTNAPLLPIPFNSNFNVQTLPRMVFDHMTSLNLELEPCKVIRISETSQLPISVFSRFLFS